MSEGKEWKGDEKTLAQIREKVVADHVKEAFKKLPPKRWTALKVATIEKEKENRSAALRADLDKRGVTIIPTEKDDKVTFPGAKVPIMLTGGLLEQTTVDQFVDVAAFINTLKQSCDPNKVCFVTTGNEHGIQKMVHNALKEAGFDVVGLIAKGAKSKDLTESMTHAVLGYDKWYDMHGFIGKQLEQNPDFQLMVFGGNMLTRHIIQTGFNVISKGDMKAKNNQIYLVKGVPGAAEDKANHLPSQFSVEGTLGLMAQFVENTKEKGILKLSRDEMSEVYQQEQSNWRQSEKNMRDNHGDMGAVDADNKADYLCRICESHNFKLEKEHALDFFMNGCLLTHPVAQEMASHSKVYKVLSPHFSALGIPNMDELVKEKESKSAMDQEKGSAIPDLATTRLEESVKRLRKATDLLQNTVKAVEKAKSGHHHSKNKHARAITHHKAHLSKKNPNLTEKKGLADSQESTKLSNNDTTPLTVRSIENLNQAVTRVKKATDDLNQTVKKVPHDPKKRKRHGRSNKDKKSSLEGKNRISDQETTEPVVKKEKPKGPPKSK